MYYFSDDFSAIFIIFLKTIDIKKMENKYNKITVNFINLVKQLFDELSSLEALILL